MISRHTAIQLLTEKLTDEILISSLGANSHQLYSLSPRKLNCYMTGGMGMCTSIGLGLALSLPNKSVICLDGDGSCLMNLRSLCTIGAQQPNNLTIIVYDNKHIYGEPTATASHVDLAKIAIGCNFNFAQHIHSEVEISLAYDEIMQCRGPNFLVIDILPTNDRYACKIDQSANFKSFRQALKFRN